LAANSTIDEAGALTRFYDEPFDELTPVEMEPVEEQQFDQPEVDAAIDPGEISLGDVATASTVVADLADVGVGGVIGDLGSLDGLDLGTGLGGDGDGTGGMGDVSFFGAKTSGKSFVFVVDNSNSMNKGRFETALNELVRAVNALGPKQQFSVIFYSDQAYGLFHPEKFPGLIPATNANKQKLLDWLYTVEMCLQTRGEEAMKMAIALNPDVIQILGDGAFGDKAPELLIAPHSRKTII